MHRVVPDYWHRPKRSDHESFCKYAIATRTENFQLFLITDPQQAADYWAEFGFAKMAKWAAAGFPGAVMVAQDGNVWILSPDPGKEIHGSS